MIRLTNPSPPWMDRYNMGIFRISTGQTEKTPEKRWNYVGFLAVLGKISVAGSGYRRNKWATLDVPPKMRKAHTLKLLCHNLALLTLLGDVEGLVLSWNHGFCFFLEILSFDGASCNFHNERQAITWEISRKAIIPLFPLAVLEVKLLNFLQFLLLLSPLKNTTGNKIPLGQGNVQ